MENKPISDYFKNKFKLWLWDWQDCMIDGSVYYNKSMKPTDIMKRTDEELDSEIPSWRYFKSLVIYLTKFGIRVGIVSFAAYEIIKAYLDRIFGLNQHYFHSKNIKAPFSDIVHQSTQYYKNKNEFIVDIMNFYKLDNPAKVIYFDDSASNITEASLIGITAVKVGGRDNDQIQKTARHLFGIDILRNAEIAYKAFENDDEKRHKALTRGDCNKLHMMENSNLLGSIGDRKVGLQNLRKAKELEELFRCNVGMCNTSDNTHELDFDCEEVEDIKQRKVNKKINDKIEKANDLLKMYRSRNPVDNDYSRIVFDKGIKNVNETNEGFCMSSDNWNLKMIVVLILVSMLIYYGIAILLNL